MKVLYVTHKPNLTGANRSLLDILDGLDRTVVEPVVLVNRKGPLLSELKVRGVPYHYAFLPPALNSDNPVLNAIKKLLNSKPFNRLAVLSVKAQMKNISPDLVHNNSLLVSAGMEGARELKIPYLCHFRDFLWEDHHRVHLYPDRVHGLIADADEVLSISNAVKEKFQPFTDKDIKVLWDGVHTEEYLEPVKPVLQKDTVELLLAGRMNEGKGQLEAVKALELAMKESPKPLHLTLVGTVGDPSYVEHLKNYVTSHGLTNVDVLEFSKDIKGLRQKADIGLTCSVSEGLGRVTVENMLASLFVITTDTAGSLEIMKEGTTGILYQAGHPEDLAEKILWAIAHKEEANQMVRQGREYAKETFDCGVYSRKLQAIYKDMLK